MTQDELDFGAVDRASALADGPTPGLAGRTAWHAAVGQEIARLTRATSVDAFVGTLVALVWRVALCQPDEATDVCSPTALSVDTRPDFGAHGPGDLWWRGACRHCAWEGPIRFEENEAIEDAHDHALPGWRNLPGVPRPSDPKRVAAVRALYRTVEPELAGRADCPIRTYRVSGSDRHHDGGALGGFDLGVLTATKEGTP